MTRPTTPLNRSVDRPVLDWDDVEPRHADAPRDVLGLRPEDRAALGLSAARTADAVPPARGDAHKALADVLATGGALAKTDKRAKKR